MGDHAPRISVYIQRIFPLFLFCAFGLAAAAQSLSQPMSPGEEGRILPSEHAVQGTPLLTTWGAEISPSNVHPEYPRPTLYRSEWLSLNGYWDWKDSSERQEAVPDGGYTHRILVPFPVESILSGVTQRTERCTYRRTFTIPPDWAGENHILLHFGAVDWEAAVFINGQHVGTHRGGYDPFSFDITSHIHRNEPNEIVVHVFDPTQWGEQPRGKQSTVPSGVKYTASTGIWQTVWLEPVPQYHIKSLQIQVDYDTGLVTVIPTVNITHKDLTVSVEVFDEDKTVAEVHGGCEGPLLMRFKKSEIKTWSPDSPYLYSLRVHVLYRGTITDKVGSYAAFRKIETVKEGDGFPVIHLNGKRLFQMGVIEQGYWPDGLYTTPSDRAHLMDIQVAKAMGFNVIRKYQKIEPERWYSWCDRVGILVWQDMPSGDNRSPAAQQQFRTELQRMIQSRSHHPSIVAWTIFNEGAGQHNVAEYVDLVRHLDRTRLVNATSGWTDTGWGDIYASHNLKFPSPENPGIDKKEMDKNRAVVIGLFGGVTLIPEPEHLWTHDPWGHQHASDSDSFVKRYKQMHEELRQLIRTEGLAGAFFHQLVDVESECSGLTTYDRRFVKVPKDLKEELEQTNRETIIKGSE